MGTYEVERMRMPEGGTQNGQENEDDNRGREI